MADPISIVVPAFNQLDYCRQCVDSIQANTRRPYRLILVDNGSTDGVAEFFDGVHGATVVHSATNRGFAGGVNLGLGHAQGHVLVLNSDTLVPEGWLERLEEALQSAPDVGIVGPMSNYVSGSQQIDGLTFTDMKAIDAFASDLCRRNAGKRRDVARLVGFCLLIRDAVVEEVGPFDEAYGIGNFEDDDYCLRVLRAGYRLCVAEDAFVFHYGGRTFLGMGVTDEKWRALVDENQRRFEAKWQVAAAERCDAAQESKRLNREAEAARAHDDSVAALRLLKDAIETFPLLESNFNDLGVLLLEMDQPDRAFDQFVRALKINPGHAEAQAHLRGLADALGRTAEAAALLGGDGLGDRTAGNP